MHISMYLNVYIFFYIFTLSMCSPMLCARGPASMADSAYRDAMDKAQHAQDDWETAMINGCKVRLPWKALLSV